MARVNPMNMMRQLCMNAENKINLKQVSTDDPQLPEVIQFSMGRPTADNILEVITIYNKADHALIGAFLDDTLIGVVGFFCCLEKITIRHISVLPELQNQGVGRVLLDHLKAQYAPSKIIAETDADSVGFYLKSGFSCHEFKGPYGNLRYKCAFNI